MRGWEKNKVCQRHCKATLPCMPLQGQSQDLSCHCSNRARQPTLYQGRLSEIEPRRKPNE
eukprot:2858296-Amphidinium_carterae.1